MVKLTVFYEYTTASFVFEFNFYASKQKIYFLRNSGLEWGPTSALYCVRKGYRNHAG